MGATEQPTKLPTIAANARPPHVGLKRMNGSFCMGLILLEALLAGLIFVLIVWWTMFSGRPKGELPDAEKPESSQPTAPGHDEPASK